MRIAVLEGGWPGACARELHLVSSCGLPGHDWQQPSNPSWANAWAHRWGRTRAHAARVLGGHNYCPWGAWCPSPHDLSAARVLGRRHVHAGAPHPGPRAVPMAHPSCTRARGLRVRAGQVPTLHHARLGRAGAGAVPGHAAGRADRRRAAQRGRPAAHGGLLAGGGEGGKGGPSRGREGGREGGQGATSAAIGRVACSRPPPVPPARPPAAPPHPTPHPPTHTPHPLHHHRPPARPCRTR
jgi:hypothetical protein